MKELFETIEAHKITAIFVALFNGKTLGEGGG